MYENKFQKKARIGTLDALTLKQTLLDGCLFLKNLFKGEDLNEWC